MADSLPIRVRPVGGNFSLTPAETPSSGIAGEDTVLPGSLEPLESLGDRGNSGLEFSVDAVSLVSPESEPPNDLFTGMFATKVSATLRVGRVVDGTATVRVAERTATVYTAMELIRILDACLEVADV